ncbi:MAG: type IV pilus secretin PilQ [Acidobacteria bacterium]|nr:type IV pilus secretin PilQ [Acidobacteriota bacterium]
MIAHKGSDIPNRLRRITAGVLGITLLASAAGGILLATAGTAVQLVGVSAEGTTVIIEATEPAAYTVNRPDKETLLVDLRGVSVAGATSRVGTQSAVSGVRFEQASAPDGVTVARVRLALTRASDYTVKSARNTIRIDLAPGAQAVVHESAGPGVPAIRVAATASPARPAPKAAGVPGPALQRAGVDAMAALRSVQPPAEAPVAPPSAPPSPPTPVLQAQQGLDISTGQERKYTGHPISMDFQGVDLRSVLRTFAEISGLNMVIDPDVQGTVDIVLTDVPWDQALEVILRGNSLDYTVDGTIVRIARLETIRKEQDARTLLAQSAANAGTLSVRTYTLSYAKADQAAPLVRSAVLSPRGNVQIDARTNTLIITDLPGRLDTVAQLLATLDRAEPQVEIEARIITTTRDFARALGVQWGFNGRVDSTIGNTPNLTFPNNGSLGGRSGVQGPAGSDPRAGALEAAGTAVNLAVPAATSAVGLALGAINGAFNLDVALTALERTGKGRILSTPRVTTQNNVEAEITQGVQIPVQTEANNTVTVTFKDAALTLKVTPQITASSTVIMQITLENATPGVPVNGIPSIDTQRAITRVQVADGMTTVMGGIFVSSETTSSDRTPVLHRVPFLSWLFKRDTNEDRSRELLIFITPRIQRG